MGCYCDYSEGDAPEFCITRRVKARKPRQCCECLEPIPTGETYERVSGRWDFGMHTFHTCAHCADLRRNARAGNPYFEGVAFGQLACWYMGEIQAEADKMDRERVQTSAPVAP